MSEIKPKIESSSGLSNLPNKALAGTLALALAAGPAIGETSEHTIEQPSTTPVTQVFHRPASEIVFEEGDPIAHIDAQAELNYGQGFETSLSDQERAERIVGHFIEQNRDALSNPEQIQAIDITGMASAENGDTADAGLQEDSPENVELAHARAELSRAELELQLRTEFGDEIANQLLAKTTEAGLEDRLSDTQVQEINEISQQLGFENANQLIDTYNGLIDGNDSLPMWAVDYLDGILASKRTSDIHLSTIPTEPVTTSETRPAETVYTTTNIPTTETFTITDQAPNAIPPNEPGYIPEESEPHEKPQETQQDSLPVSLVPEEEILNATERTLTDPYVTTKPDNPGPPSPLPTKPEPVPSPLPPSPSPVPYPDTFAQRSPNTGIRGPQHNFRKPTERIKQPRSHNDGAPRGSSVNRGRSHRG